MLLVVSFSTKADIATVGAIGFIDIKFFHEGKNLFRGDFMGWQDSEVI